MSIQLREVNSMDEATSAKAHIEIEHDRINMDFTTATYLNVTDEVVPVEVGMPSRFLRFTGQFLVLKMETDHVVENGEIKGVFTYFLESVNRPIGFLPVEGEFLSEDLVLITA